jgi:hypothetical protein
VWWVGRILYAEIRNKVSSPKFAGPRLNEQSKAGRANIEVAVVLGPWSSLPS